MEKGNKCRDKVAQKRRKKKFQSSMARMRDDEIKDSAVLNSRLYNDFN